MIKRLVHNLLGNIEGDLRGLIFPWYLPSLIHSQRAYLIISRVRLIALMFSILTPLWIAMDAQLLPRTTGESLAWGRGFTALGFAGLFFILRRSDKVFHAYMGTVLLFLIPTLFYFYSHNILQDLETEQMGLAASLVAGYFYLPFVLVVGLAFFPLSALEGVIFVFPAFLLMAYTGLVDASQQEFWDQLGMLWLMGMIATAAILSGMSQLHYLSEIIIKSAHDPLTKALNRASGAEILDKYFLLSQRNSTPLTVMFFDLDNFKQINDNNGHEAGDIILQELVDNISSKLRREDLVIRWGGEEFIAAFPHTDGLAENSRTKLFERIAGAGLGNRPNGEPLTASVGVAELLTDKVDNLNRLVELADERMYKAKKSGRDRVCYGDSSEDMTPSGFFAKAS